MSPVTIETSPAQTHTDLVNQTIRRMKTNQTTTALTAAALRRVLFLYDAIKWKSGFAWIQSICITHLEIRISETENTHKFTHARTYTIHNKTMCVRKHWDETREIANNMILTHVIFVRHGAYENRETRRCALCVFVSVNLCLISS